MTWTRSQGPGRTWLLGIVAAAVLSLLMVTTTLADNTVTQTVTCPTNGLTASIANLSLPAATYSHSDATSAGSMTLSVADNTCLGLGWNVTVLAGSFAYSGTGQGQAIPAASFALTSAATPVKVAGQDRSVVGGPNAVTQTGTLDSARKVINATPLFGQGSYTQALGVSLTIPAQSAAGTYTSTLVVSVTAGP